MAAPKKTTKRTTKAKASPAKKSTKKTTPKTTQATAIPAPSLSLPPRTLPKLPFSLPARTFIKWAAVIIVIFAVISTWLATTLVEARQQDLVAEIKERTAIQAQGRAAVVSEWLAGQLQSVNNLTESDLMRLFVAEMTNQSQQVDAGMRAALVAQVPYMQQTVRELVQRNAFTGAAVVGRDGAVVLSSEEALALTTEQTKAINTTFATGQAVVQGAAMVETQLVAELYKPIFELQDEDQNPRVTGVLMLQIPLKEKLRDLLDVGPLARDGEQTLLLQRADTAGSLEWVTSTALQPLELNEKDLIEATIADKATLKNPASGAQAFASLLPVPSTPFRMMHVFEAKKALAFMELYKNGVYGMVVLATLALISVTLFIVGHLLAQRNRARVKHQGKAMEALVRAIEIRDPYLSGHHDRMARLAVNLGNDLDLPVRQRSTLYYAAQLSGVGKIFISQKTLQKKSKLTTEERAEVEAHIPHAMMVLKDMEFELPIAEVIEQMYERMDGTGYPQHLKGGEINILSRALAVCDAFCALTRPRAYRDALTEADAIAELRRTAAGYDTKVLDALEKRITGS